MTRPIRQIFLFANPIAGRGRSLQLAGRLHERLAREGFVVQPFYDPPDSREAREILLQQPQQQARPHCILVIGGDGTLRGVAEQVLRAAETRAEPPPPLLVVPVGTANLMGQHLGLRWSDEHLEAEVLAALERHRVVQLDAARANGRLLLLVAGVGIDAAIVHEVHRRRSGPITKASYVRPALAAISAYANTPLTVTVDGRRITDGCGGIAFVGNIPQYGTGFPVLVHARPDDGVLDVCVIPCASRGDILRMFLHAAAGEHLMAEGVVYVKGRQIHIDAPQPVPVQIDGEAAGHTPLHIDLLPLRLPFIVP